MQRARKFVRSPELFLSTGPTEFISMLPQKPLLRAPSHSMNKGRNTVISITSFPTRYAYALSMSEPLSWQPEPAATMAEIDRQHQNLVRIIQNLHRAIAAGRGQEVIESALAQVVNYTIYHFATEEDLMQQHGFPGIVAHRIAHNDLTLKIFGFQEEHAVGKPEAAEGLLNFLQQWLEEHTWKKDNEFALFLNAKGIA